MHFSWNIDVGTLAAFVGAVIGMAKLHKNNIERFKGVETKVDLLYDWMRAKMHISGD